MRYYFSAIDEVVPVTVDDIDWALDTLEMFPEEESKYSGHKVTQRFLDQMRKKTIKCIKGKIPGVVYY